MQIIIPSISIVAILFPFLRYLAKAARESLQDFKIDGVSIVQAYTKSTWDGGEWASKVALENVVSVSSQDLSYRAIMGCILGPAIERKHDRLTRKGEKWPEIDTLLTLAVMACKDSDDDAELMPLVNAAMARGVSEVKQKIMDKHLWLRSGHGGT